jgi:hypothetical protein
MTEVYLIIDGKKVRVPNRPYEASDLGWHRGADYGSALNWKEHDFVSIKEWCEATFDPHTYKMFMRSVWFLHEQDALLCKLRWS